MNRLQKLPRTVVVPGDPGTPTRVVCEVKTSPSLDVLFSADPTIPRTAASYDLAYLLKTGAAAERMELAYPGQPPQVSLGGQPGSGWAFAPSAQVDSRTECSIIPGRPATPRAVSYQPDGGWTGGGRSIDWFEGDGYAEFSVSPGLIGAVVGLNSRTDTLSPTDCQHAFYVHMGSIDIMESGAIVHSVAGAVTVATKFRIVASPTSVKYLVDGALVYTSESALVGPVYLDAALYATGDYVHTPAIAQLTDIARASGSVAVRAFLDGGLAAASVVVGGQASAARNGVAAKLPALTGFAAYTQTSRMVAAYRGRPSLESYGGLPSISYAYAGGTLPRMQLSGTMLTGGVGAVSGTVPAVLGAAGEAGYSFVRAAIPSSFRSFAYDPLYDDNSLVFVEPVLMVDMWHVEITALATFRSVLQLGDAVELELILEQGFEWFDFLMAHSSVQELGDKDLSWADALAITSQGSTAAAGAQYATNVATGALSRYAGYDYLAVTDTLRGSFGIRPDGIYRLGVAGAPVDGHVDFGANDLGERMPKRIEALFFGLTTDGEVFAVMQGDDGRKRTYRVTRREPYMRANIGQGMAAKHWHLRLELFDATEAELQEVEFVASATTRRWTK